jgi:hypothetical protein
MKSFAVNSFFVNPFAVCCYKQVTYPSFNNLTVYGLTPTLPACHTTDNDKRLLPTCTLVRQAKHLSLLLYFLKDLNVTGSGTAAEATTQQGRAHTPGNRENKEIMPQDHQL